MIFSAMPSAYFNVSNKPISHEQKNSKESYRYCLLETLEGLYKDKALPLFQRVYSAFNAALESHFENIPAPALALQGLIENVKVLDEIAEKLATGALVLDRAKILEKYPKLKAALEAPAPLLKQTFENILSSSPDFQESAFLAMGEVTIV